MITRQESGARGMVALLAKYGEKQVAEWRRKGGRPKDPTLLEIREAQRRAAEAKAATRRSRRVSLRGGGSQSNEFDAIT